MYKHLNLNSETEPGKVQKFSTPFNKNKFILLGLILGFISTLALVIISRNFSSNNPGRSEVLSQTDDLLPGLTDTANLKTLGILLLGYGGAGHDGGFLTDAVQLIYVDFDRATIAFVSFPRDLWVKTADGREMKLNAVAAASGKKSGQNPVANGAESLKSLIEQITGLGTDYFIGIDFVGFQRAIGLNLKGIEVEIGETLDDPWYPVQGKELETCGMTPGEITKLHAKYTGFELERQFPCRYEHLRFEKGKVIMQGGDALKYVRSRHGSSAGDMSRNIRQQEVLSAVKNKIISLDGLKNLPGSFREFAVHTSTDINTDIVKFLLPAITKASQFKVKNINLSTANVLTSGSAGSAQIIKPKEGLHNYTAVKKFITDQLEILSTSGVE